MNSAPDLSDSKKQLGYLLIIFGFILLLILAFVKINYDAQAAFLCENIEAADGDMAACPAHKTDTSWLFLGGFGMSLVLILAGTYLGFIEKPAVIVAMPSTAAFVPADTSAMDADSKAVCEALNAHKGSVFQSDLVRDTGFSKVKISRILDKLEQEQIIERKRRGMANIVVLK